MKAKLKILKMKKKLYETDVALIYIITLALIGLLIGIISSLRVLYFPKLYAQVNVKLPVLIENIKDPTYHNFIQQPTATITNNTIVIIMDAKGNLFFGDLKAFSSDFHLATNKFVIYQQDGSPQVGNLLYNIEQWIKQREQTKHIIHDGIAIFVPSVSLPMSIVTLTVNELNNSNIFNHVILGAGLL